MTTTLAYGRAQLDRAALADDGPLTFVASSDGLNRYGYALRTDGWRLDAYNANPVVLWMHNSFRPPIGQGRALNKDAHIVLDAVEFDRDDELARMVESKYRRGFLNAVSVGFHFVQEDGAPVDTWRMKSEEIRDELFYDLVEVSAVTTPADPRALRQQSRLALAGLGKELVELFDEQEQGAATAEEIRTAVRAELAHLGIDLAALTKKEDPEDDAPAGIDQEAAGAVLAAFSHEGRNL
ncbi:HK97 family phage prohead protease [Prauserella muralis]|uniref:Prohead serine protease domain-containing protein n=1 Tax=Prauserella muralis TaxID=588067 RepID=A0A2V4ALL8_9PSEU|nr:HK97 family phage prohead protease [Prauserella muralis]PXY21132.1 hypothetical protein BAY60_27075 [Prauserella muralis]TWE30220.1 prohead serine protease [Prauserella muralis]